MGDSVWWWIDSLKLLRCLLVLYFAMDTGVCALGFSGILKNNLAYIRSYRDYSIVDTAFSGSLIVLATYGAFRGQTRASVCEQISQYPELMRDMLEMGLSIENCEQGIERAVLSLLAILCVVMAVRLYFLLAVCKYYSHLDRHQYRQRGLFGIGYRTLGPNSSPRSTATFGHNSTTLQRIYLLPRQPQQGDDRADVVYAPVPLDSLPIQMQVQTMEAWVHRPNTILSPQTYHFEHLGRRYPGPNTSKSG
ncbi:hypothetical protein FA15DRAFT_664585 [Coprinopsis marcescibilis]|uniref:Uncharacterized protein n=1 Tax=Coprinopsis marcescibilis TaxID=230819 RepID=A0A5C3LJY7_COPMA|nr:hypothetical protein FA15DRAFT_664585 [Coprinopsis marcescibilis]